MNRVLELRKELHRHPELSGAESETARRILRFFEPLDPDATLSGLGGHGLAFVYEGTEPGPTVLLRSELDALPIREANSCSYRSRSDGVSHKCGHDGHMAILAAVGEELSKNRPRRGRAVLLFQPAEETGAGAAAVISDDAFSEIRPEFAYALHNLPGYRLGEVLVRPGTMSCASRGITIQLRGATAHASQPHTGRNPTGVMMRIIQELDELPFQLGLVENAVFATVTGARLGAEENFGIAPGYARILATLRSETEDTMERMVRHCQQLVERLASTGRLECEITQHDVFPPTINSPSAVDAIRRVAGGAGVTVPEVPFPWSEDFGRFLVFADGALFGIGAGKDIPELHGPEYDFPDDLIPLGKEMFNRILSAHLGPV